MPLVGNLDLIGILGYLIFILFITALNIIHLRKFTHHEVDPGVIALGTLVFGILQDASGLEFLLGFVLSYLVASGFKKKYPRCRS